MCTHIAHLYTGWRWRGSSSSDTTHTHSPNWLAWWVARVLCARLFLVRLDSANRMNGVRRVFIYDPTEFISNAPNKECLCAKRLNILNNFRGPTRKRFYFFSRIYTRSFDRNLYGLLLWRRYRFLPNVFQYGKSLPHPQFWSNAHTIARAHTQSRSVWIEESLRLDNKTPHLHNNHEPSYSFASYVKHTWRLFIIMMPK